jgi:acyl dehydratase
MNVPAGEEVHWGGHVAHGVLTRSVFDRVREMTEIYDRTAR